MLLWLWYCVPSTWDFLFSFICLMIPQISSSYYVPGPGTIEANKSRCLTSPREVQRRSQQSEGSWGRCNPDWRWESEGQGAMIHVKGLLKGGGVWARTEECGEERVFLDAQEGEQTGGDMKLIYNFPEWIKWERVTGVTAQAGRGFGVLQKSSHLTWENGGLLRSCSVSREMTYRSPFRFG